MKSYSFYDNKHLDTVFNEQNNNIKMMNLFGMKMETQTELAERITGTFEVFSSLGAVNGRQSAKVTSIDSENFKYEIKLYNGELTYISEWKYYAEIGVFSRRDKIVNTGDCDVTLFKGVQKYLFIDEDFSCYTQNTRWCYENIGQWCKVNFGGVSLACEGGRTSQGATPFLALKSNDDNGAVFHIVPNGNWKIDLKTVSLGVSQAGEYGHLLEIGQNNNHFSLTMQPEEVFEFPEVIIQKLVHGSLAKTAVNLQKYFLIIDKGRNRIEHPVVYNPWFESYALLEVERLKEHVNIAKELGCEVFEIDAGWYGSQPGDWWSQAGDWTEKLDGAFYGKMIDFIAYVKANGLRFGLWMEPERIGKTTPIMKAHPEYFAKGNEHYYPKLYLPEVFEYMYGEITGIIKKYGLSWMKMDFNFELGEDETTSEFYLYYKAWYALLEKIKINYPDVFLEGCAAGGMRNDIHTTTVYDGHFLSDNVNSWDMQATYQQCCLRLPHYRLIKWLVVSPGAKISLYGSTKIEKVDTIITTQRPGAGWDEYENITPEFACQLTMSGLVGLSGNFIDLNHEQKQVFKKYIIFYKRYRNFYKDSVIILSDDPKNVGDKDGFHHLQYNHLKTGEQLVFVYRYNTASNSYMLRLQDLLPEKTYEIYDPVTNEKFGVYSGEHLMYRGLNLVFDTRNSGKIFYLK